MWIVSFLCGICIGMVVCLYWANKNVIEVTDTFFPNKSRSKTQQEQDAVLQLKNEIAKSGALKLEYSESGTVKVTLRVVKK